MNDKEMQNQKRTSSLRSDAASPGNHGRPEPGKVARKRFRKELRSHWISYVAKDSWNRFKQNLFDRFFCIFFWRKRLRRSLEYTINATSSGLLVDGIVTDYMPESLGKIDEAIMYSLEEIGEKEGVKINETLRWVWYEGLGGYLGETIIRNIGGNWVFPSPRKLWRARLLRDLSLFYDYWYVNLNGKLIPVIKVARLRQDGSGRVSSFVNVYEEIAAKGCWSEMPARSSGHSKSGDR